MITNETILNKIISPVRNIRARVEFYEGSTLVETCNCNDRLIKFTVNRIGESKFFGFGIIQKLNVHLIDKDRELSFSTQNSIKIVYKLGEEEIAPHPTFYISEIHRDENTNELSITAYDVMYPDNEHLLGDLTLQAPYTLNDLTAVIAGNLGANGYIVDAAATGAFTLELEKGGNFESTDSIRECLADIAEATQTIFYINNEDKLVFKRLKEADEPVFTISKSDYITLSSKTNRRLGRIFHTTELGDNLDVSMEAAGTTQYVRDNGIWTAFESTEILELLNQALTAIGGLTINQFDCSWRGNILLEIGDKIGLITKDDEEVYSFVLDDVITYDGTLSEKTIWQYEDEDETATNPTTIGDRLNQTYAKVDKANQEITLVAGEVTSIKLTNEDIQSSVKKIDAELEEIIAEVNTKVTAEDVSISIKNAIAEEGITAVTTTTGFTFNQDGLNVTKSSSDMKTLITEDGMKIYRRGDEILVANNEGVMAEDLHATTFLIIGNNSRLEDYGNSRSSCFFIGRA